AIAIDGRGTNCGTFVLAWSVEQSQSLLPVISLHPQPQSVRRGDPLTLSVNAASVPTTLQLSYQWFLNGLPIPGANERTYQLPRLANENVGTYTVRVFNGGANARFVESDPTVVEIGPISCIQSQDKPEDIFLNC